ncbi:MAG: bifunctional UDP-4-keto-pentose/UDP-xylose synthase, partial [Alphaproteobacteria bacterium]|nr:bifunctional UDP-4-keto-pentose/UDP-xylose synthase [Alphaproteobacteria bacterium]
LAELLIRLVKDYPAYKAIAEKVKITDVTSSAHYGIHYQDINRRVPSITNALKILGWSPKINLEDALRKTLDYHLGRSAGELDSQ